MPGVAGRRFARPFHALLYVLRQFVLAADVFEADVVLVERGNFGLQVAAQQAHQKVDFALGALLPVFFGKSVKGERGDANACGGFHRGPHCRHSGAMTRNARHVATASPASIAVHNNGDMFWEPSSIETPVDFGFLAVEPGGYFVLQSDPSNKRLTQGPSLWQ